MNNHSHNEFFWKWLAEDRSNTNQHKHFVPDMHKAIPGIPNLKR